MAERRYDEDETRTIFDQASRVPSRREDGAPLPGAHGFTLAELQEIGAEAGLDEDRIAEAARALDSAPGAPPPARRLAGLPIGVSRAVVLGPVFDEDDWNHLVVDLRETFNARGRIRVQGAFREWNNGNLQALVEPTDEGFRLQLRTVKGSAYGALWMGIGAVVLALFMMVAFAVQGQLGEEWTSAVLLGALGIGSIGVSALQLPAWARTREQQMEEVSARALLRARRDGAEA
jgi:hypothetical protein